MIKETTTTVSCFSKVQIGFAFLVPAHPGSPGKRAVKRVCVCVCTVRVRVCCLWWWWLIININITFMHFLLLEYNRRDKLIHQFRIRQVLCIAKWDQWHQHLTQVKVLKM